MDHIAPGLHPTPVQRVEIDAFEAMESSFGAQQRKMK